MERRRDGGEGLQTRTHLGVGAEHIVNVNGRELTREIHEGDVKVDSQLRVGVGVEDYRSVHRGAHKSSKLDKKQHEHEQTGARAPRNRGTKRETSQENVRYHF